MGFLFRSVSVIQGRKRSLLMKILQKWWALGKSGLELNSQGGGGRAVLIWGGGAEMRHRALLKSPREGSKRPGLRIEG